MNLLSTQFLDHLHRRTKRILNTVAGVEDSESKKTIQTPSDALESNVADTVHSSGEELDEEVDFYIKRLASGDLSEEAALKLKEQAKTLRYTFRATIFARKRCPSLRSQFL